MEFIFHLNLNATVFIGEEVPAQGQGASWGSYLPRWSGLV